MPDYRPAYPASQAGSSSISHHKSSSPRYSAHSHQRPRAPSTSSTTTSSQSTLISPTAQAHSLAAYPAAPRSQTSSGVGPSAYRAPSIASTSAARQSRVPHHTSSRSRQRRSQEVEHEIQNNFPWFGQTGDVEIRLCDREHTTEKRYLLHGLILAQNSKWFESESACRTKNASVAGAGYGLSYMSRSRRSSLERIPPSRGPTFELDWAYFVDEQERIPALAQADPNSAFASRSPLPPVISTHNKPSAPSTSFFRSLASGIGSTQAPTGTPPLSKDDDILRAYDNLFLALYNHSPNLSTTHIATAYVDAKLLLGLASYYSAIDTVGPRIDHHLLQFGSRLWKQIAKYPPSYLKLGHLAKSRAIFSEALVHVVGTWPLAQAQLKRGAPGIDEQVINLIEDKVDELEEIKLRVDAKLFRISLTTGRGERVGPANGYVDWLALSLYRQWVADNTVPAQTGILKDSPTSPRDSATNRQPPQTSPRLVQTYRAIAAGGQAYLSHDDCKRFLKLRPADYSREHLRRLERRMDELKNLAREVVRPLTRHCLELDAGNGFDHLTCARCEERDFAYVWKST